MKYLLDTNVFREIGKSRPHEHIRHWLAGVDDSELAISALTIREVARGIARLAVSKPEVADAIQDRAIAVFDAFEGRILPVDRRVAQHWGERLAASEKHVDDAGIAATARIHGLIVVTRNVRHFEPLGVAVLDPFRSPPRRFG
jgi:predicted nucleic acid-binding protein